MFQVRGRTFAHHMDDHHGDGRVALWVKSTHQAQADAVEAEPERFFVRPTSVPRAGSG